MDTATLIRAIGEALFGSRWQTDLGDQLGVNRRTVKRWLAGEFEPLPGVWEELEDLLRAQADEHLRLCEAIRARGLKSPAEDVDAHLDGSEGFPRRKGSRPSTGHGKGF